jgi:hypothetical protein
MHFFVMTIGLPISFRDAFALLLHERFESDDEGESSEGIQEIEKITWLRWLFFVLGTLPGAIKLMGLKGVPWTKAWGMMFLVSFLVVESLVILSTTLRGRYNVIRPQQIHPWPHRELLLNEGVNKRLALTRALTGWLSVLSLTFHYILLYLAFIHLWGPPKGFQDSFPMDILAIIILIFMLLLCVASGAALSRKEAKPRLYAVIFIIMMGFLSDYFFQYVQKFFDLGGISNRVVKASAFTVTYFVVYYILALMNSLFRELGKQLLLGREVEWNGPFIRSNDNIETYAFLELFIVTLTTSVPWYCYRFDPTGTVNPPWTGIFG